jgi:hypothetical protein
VEANPEFRGIFEELSANPNFIKKGLKQALPWPVRILSLLATALKLWALLFFVTNPNPSGLVGAAWLYILAQVLFFIIQGAVGFTAGLRRAKFFNGLSEADQWQLTRMVLREQALQGFYGREDGAVFLDWYAPVIEDILKEKTKK